MRELSIRRTIDDVSESSPRARSGAARPAHGRVPGPGGDEAGGPPPHPRLAAERALSEEVEALSEATSRLGRTFATGHDLHDTDFRALGLIHVAETRGGSMTPAMLGAHLGLSSGAVTYLLDRLERGGHVVRARDPHDGRRVLLRYADHGREVATAFFGPLARHQHAALTEFDDAEIETARRVLHAVTDAVRAYHAEIDPPGGTARRRDRDRG